MTIDSRWLKKDFKQKYFLYCKYCDTDKIIPNKLAQVENNGYVCRIIIKEVKDEK